MHGHGPVRSTHIYIFRLPLLVHLMEKLGALYEQNQFVLILHVALKLPGKCRKSLKNKYCGFTPMKKLHMYDTNQYVNIDNYCNIENTLVILLKMEHIKALNFPCKYSALSRTLLPKFIYTAWSDVIRLI